MPAIAQQVYAGFGLEDPVARTVMTADTPYTVPFNAKKRQMLLLFCGTLANPVTVTIVGDQAPAAYGVIGVGEIDLSAGTSWTLNSGDTLKIDMQKISALLAGEVTLTADEPGCQALIETSV